MRWLFLLSLIVLIWDESLAVEPKVLKETPFDFERDEKGKLVVKKRKYVDYRPLWGKRITLISAEHTPTPELLDQSRVPIQLEVSLVRNFKALSFGAEAGFMSVEWENPSGGAIDMTNYYVGLVGHLDGLFSWPVVVPFASVGGVSINAEIDGATIDANDFVVYYRAGFLFSLNWIDRMMSIRAYDDFGLLNSYIYVGVRQWLETNSDPNLNLEIDPSLEFGLQLEF
jgi:hypothetical protein